MYMYMSVPVLRLLCYICRANSVTWNPHKMMGVPLQCSAILVREKVRLRVCGEMGLGVKDGGGRVMQGHRDENRQRDST